jgi:hypothetical protein
MAELQHDRAPDPTVTQTSALRAGELRTTAACVCVRLWSHGSLRPEDPFSSSLDPAACMANDILVASEGSLATTHGNTLLVRFADVSQAILAARRLQWAFQGFSEVERFSGTSIAILVSSSEDMPGGWAEDFFSASLDRAAPGQVLLAVNAGRAIESVPGLATEATADPQLRGLLLRRPERGSNSSSDEKTLFRNIIGQATGEFGSSEEHVHLISGTSTGDKAEAVLVQESLQDERSRKGRAGFWAGLNQTRRILWGSGAALALLLLTGCVLFAFRSNRTATPPSVQHLPPVAEGPFGTNKQPGPPKIAGGKPIATGKVVNTGQTGSRPRTEPGGPDAAPGGKPSGSRCDFNPDQANSTLEHAEQNLDNGKWDAANRDYRSLLGCPGYNTEALDGLQKVHSRRAVDQE